jgi:aminoglycoside phosphotransferase
VLGHSDVAAYLLESGMFDRDAIPANGLSVLDASGRNRVFVVTGRGTAGYVVKQSDVRDHDLLAHEATVLRQVVAAEPRLAQVVPNPVLYDPARRALVCELVGDAMDLGAYHSRGRFPPMLAGAVGRALALLHGLSPEAVDALPAARQTAPLLNPAPLELVIDMSDAGVQLLRVLQGSSELCDRLAELEGSGDASAIVHGDMRPSNCVAFPRPGARRRTRIALVDWESAHRGDPHLDLGAVLGEYLHAWLWSMWVLDGRDLARTARHARYPLSAMQPAISAFWLAYLDQGDGPRPSVRRAIEFAAAHLVDVAFERAHMQASLDPRAGLALQLSLNLLRRPAEAAVELLGLPVLEVAA